MGIKVFNIYISFLFKKILTILVKKSVKFHFLLATQHEYVCCDPLHLQLIFTKFTEDAHIIPLLVTMNLNALNEFKY